MARKPETAAPLPVQAPVLEWIVAGLGLVFVATALALLLAQAVGGRDQPPDLSVLVEDTRSTRSGWVVEVTVRNHGDQTAAGVQLRGEADGRTAAAELDYVPGRGDAKASLRFEQAPGPDLKVAVVGWRAP